MALERGLVMCTNCTHVFSTEISGKGSVTLVCEKCNSDIELFHCSKCKRVVNRINDKTKICPECEMIEMSIICPICECCELLKSCVQGDATLHCPNCQKDIRKNLELEDHMIERNDIINNAVFECLKVLAEKELDWNMRAIHEATEQMKCVLESIYGVKVKHYAVVTKEDGSQCYEDGLEEDE